MPARFAATRTALAAIRNIVAWEARLETVEVSGVKGLKTSLGRLKRLLQAEELDGAAIAKRVVSIAGEVGRVEVPRGRQVEELAAAWEAAQPK